MGDLWIKRYEDCMQLGHDTMQAINERNKNPRSSSAYIKIPDSGIERVNVIQHGSCAQQSAAIRSSMAKFQQDMNGLRESLLQSSLQSRITQRESDRRQNMIDQLITKHKQLELANDNKDLSEAQRTALLSSAYTRPYDDPLTRDGASSGDTDLIDIGEMRQQQQRIMAEQDQGLEALSRIIGRQRQIALDIGNEVESQNELIDDIRDHVDQTNTRLIRETRHISIIEKKSSPTCWMWIVIFLLTIAIVVIVAVPYNRNKP